MATISDTVAARAVMDLGVDRTVTNATPYGNIDLVSAQFALKYAQAIWDNRHPAGTAATNDELAAFYFVWLKQQHKDELIKARSRSAGRTAQGNEQATATSEANAEFGS